MLAGPVCHLELVRIARRRRTFALRFLLGLVALGVIALQFVNHSSTTQPWYEPGVYSLDELARLGGNLFASIMAVQVALVLGVTPGLLADAIASERRRKTLHDLLTSRLSGGEIVRGKLAARLVELGTFPALLFPIMSLLTLFGGVSPVGLVLGYVALASSAYFLGALSLLASVLSRRPRDAVGFAYTLTAAWLVVPGLLDAVLASIHVPMPAAAFLDALRLANRWTWPGRPWGLIETGAGSILGGGLAEAWRVAAWPVGTQVAYGTLFLALAGWQLRPAYRRQEARAGRRTRKVRRARRWFPIRPCGDDPVFWKEAYFTSAGLGLGGKLQRTLVFAALGLAFLGAIYASRGAFGELWEHGYGYGDSSSYSERLTLSMVLRVGCAALFGFWMLSLAGATAATFSSEHEQDTWISLLATPLERDEILRGKMLGPLRATAPFGAILLALWGLGLAAGAVHPLGLICSVMTAAVLTWFVVALGTYSSLKSKVTWRARARAQGILVGSHFCCMFWIPSILPMMGLSLWSYFELHEIFLGATSVRDGTILVMLYPLGGMVLYAIAAGFLMRWIVRVFDREADRPRHPASRDAALALSRDFTRPKPDAAPLD